MKIQSGRPPSPPLHGAPPAPPSPTGPAQPVDKLDPPSAPPALPEPPPPGNSPVQGGPGFFGSLAGETCGLVAPLFGSVGPLVAEPLRGPSETFQIGRHRVQGSTRPEGSTLQNEPLRTFSNPGGSLAELSFPDLSQGEKGRPGLKNIQTFSADDVEERFQQLDRNRKARLHNLGHNARLGQVVPKDNSLRPSYYTMYLEPGDDLSRGFVEQMAQIGKVEGFGILVAVPEEQRNKLARELDLENLTLLPINGNGGEWTEDYGEMTLDGAGVVPARLDPDLVERAIDADRLERFPFQRRWWNPADWFKPNPGDFSRHGAVSRGEFQEEMVAVQMARGKKVREALSHLEGGNLLTGTLPNGQGYALVGKDSFAVSLLKLEEDLGRTVRAQEVREAIASDLGLEAANVHAIEQPGEFHLDMRMMAVAPGQVVLNDARAAARQQCQWMRDDYRKQEPIVSGALSAVRHFGWWLRGKALDNQVQQILQEGERRAFYEDMTDHDLRKAGLDVYRVAGIYLDPHDVSEDSANLLNGRQGTNPRGEKFFIGLGAEPRQERYLAEQLLKHIPTGIQRVHFLDRELTPGTLSLYGGIKCRTKPEGNLA